MGTVMSRRWCRTCLIFLIALLAVSTSTWAQSQSQNGIEIWGPRYSPVPHGTNHQHSTGTDSLHHWNLVAVNASGLDHTPVAAGDTRVFGEQFGPGRASRPTMHRGAPNRLWVLISSPAT